MSVPAQSALLPPPPPGSDWRTKLIWYLVNTAATALVYQQFDYGQEINPTQTAAEDPDPSVWMHIQCRWGDQQSQEPADDQVFTLDVLNYTGDLVDNSWTQGDMDSVANSVAPFNTALAPYVASRYALNEIRMYRRSFNPYSNPKPFSIAGGPAAVYPGGIPGTATAIMPPQVTSTITEVTPSRKHWGRMYLPGLGDAMAGGTTKLFATTGRLTNSVVTALATAAADLAGDLAADNFRLVVPTTSSGGVFNPTLEGDWSVVPARTLQQVNAFRVDDVSDVHRSRRLKKSLFRVELPV